MVYVRPSVTFFSNIFQTTKKKYEGKPYKYENFTRCSEMLSEFKNAKKNNFGNILKIIIENRRIASEFKTWPLKALNLLLL